LSSVISTVAVAPAGITAPFDPVTELLTVALKRWPTRFVFVQMRELELRLISDPAGIDPSLRSDPDVPFVTVFPLSVRVGAEGVTRGGVVVRGGVLTVVDGRLGVREGVVATAVGDSSAGTSVRAGCADVS
jgi:hypothetical protein